MIKLVAEDVGNQLLATLTRENDGSAVDISEATTVMKFYAKGSDTVLATLSNVATDSQKALGIAIFEFSDGDLDVDEGKYEGEIEVSFDSGAEESVYELVEFFVRSKRG